jgi:hypothetical protein
MTLPDRHCLAAKPEGLVEGVDQARIAEAGIDLRSGKIT